MTMDKVETLLYRLWAACQRLPNYGGDLFGRGRNKIEEKYGVRIYLQSFCPDGMIEGEMPTQKITITAPKDF